MFSSKFCSIVSCSVIKGIIEGHNTSVDDLHNAALSGCIDKVIALHDKVAMSITGCAEITPIYIMHEAHRGLSMRVGVATSQLDLPSRIIFVALLCIFYISSMPRLKWGYQNCIVRL